MKKPAFLFINLSGDFLSIHQRVVEEGYTAFSWYEEGTIKGKGCAGKGMIELVDDFWDVLKQYIHRKDEIIIMIDDNSRGDMCDCLRIEGWKVIGSSHFADEIEHEREKGNELAEKIGLEISPFKLFSDFNSAKKFLIDVKKKEPEKMYVFKPDGVELAGSSKTYLAKSIDDMLKYVQWIEKDQAVNNYKCDKFLLQEYVGGVEADFAVWYNGEKLAPVMPITFEQKKIHGLGAATGCLGQVFFYGTPDDGYFENHLIKLAKELKVGGTNEYAVNNIVSEENHKPYFLEFTPRFGWDSTFGELSLLKDAGRSIGDFFTKIAFGIPFPKKYFPTNRYSAAVRIFSESVHTKGECVKGKSIYWDKKYEDNFWWYSVRERDGLYEITDNPIGVVSACGDSIEEAAAKVYGMLRPENMIINTPDIFYSETIGEGVVPSVHKLQDWGLLKK